MEAYEALEPAADGRPRAKMTLIRAGKSLNRRNYRATALEAAVRAGKYDGARMFRDHSKLPAIKRPLDEMVSAVEEGSVVWNPKNGPQGAVEGTVIFFDPAFAEKVKNAQGYMGTSVSNLVRGFRTVNTDGTVDEDVHTVERVHSVDWVVYPAAGGELMHFLESEEGDDDVIDWSKITIEDIRKNAPEVMAALAKEAAGPEDEPEDDGDGAVKLTEESISKIVVKAITDHETAKSAATVARTKALGVAEEAVKKSGLPEVVRKRLTTQFAATATEAITEEAVKAILDEAKEEVKALGVGPKLIGFGPSSGSSGSTSKTGSGPMRGSAREGVESIFAPKKDPKKETADAASEGAK